MESLKSLESSKRHLDDLVENIKVVVGRIYHNLYNDAFDKYQLVQEGKLETHEARAFIATLQTEAIELLGNGTSYALRYQEFMNGLIALLPENEENTRFKEKCAMQVVAIFTDLEKATQSCKLITIVYQQLCVID